MKWSMAWIFFPFYRVFSYSVKENLGEAGERKRQRERERERIVYLIIAIIC